jgi:hypothetical protein
MGGIKCIHGRQRQTCKEKSCIDDTSFKSQICIHMREKRSCIHIDCVNDPTFKSNVCEHLKNSTNCRHCFPNSFCKHDKVKSRCKECGGGSLCKHGVPRGSCRVCSITKVVCIHGILKRNCRKCGKKCTHGRIMRTWCIPCKRLICKHDKYIKTCKECFVGYVYTCKHGKHRYTCKECCMGYVYTCKHGKHRYICKECDGPSICEHKKLRFRCRDCKGSGICEHDKRRVNCTICDPTSAFVETNRSRCNAALKAGCIKKEKHTMEYLGCTPEEFRVHIASTFTEGMTMENHGRGVDRWAIDHRIALMYRDPLTKDKPSKEEIIKRLHYTNTQAMWAIENSRKGNR